MGLKRETDVLVVGAGPVGLFSALLLAERGIDVQIVDEEWRTAAHSYALALHPQTLDLLADHGLAGPLLEQGRRVDRVGLWDRDGRRAGFTYSDLSSRHPFLLVLPQSMLEGLLEECLRKAKVRVNWNHEVAGLEPGTRTAAATINKMGKVSEGYPIASTEWVIEKSSTVQARFVVGADGHRSMVRRTLGIDYEPVGDADVFAVFEFETDAEQQNEMRIVVSEGLTSVMWPLPEGRVRWSFQLPSGDELSETRHKSRLAIQIGRQSFPHLSDEHLDGFLRERAPWFTSRPEKINWSMVIRFERRLVNRLGRDNVWLVGDAGHLTGPVGIQSMNVGLREARDLVTRIESVLRQGAPLDALTDYEAERLTEWRELLGVTSALKPGDGTDAWVRPLAPRLLACVPESGENLRALVRQLGLALAPR